MSHNNNDDNKEDDESPRPRQLQYNYPPPPANHNNFYPPPPHHHPPSSYHHSSYHPHGGAISYYNGTPGGSSLQTTADGTTLSYGNPHGHYHHYYYGGGGVPHNHHQDPPINKNNNNIVKSPYFSPSPPPLPPVPVEAASAQQPPEEAKAIYQKSPYFNSEAPSLGDGGGSSESTVSTTISTDVNVPLPPKSAFMCFSEAKGNEIAQMRGSEKSGFVEAVASEWKQCSKQEKAYWENMAKNEKTRFAKEKEALCLANKGPVVKKVRAKKNPLAPKRNMSAFLMFAQQRRRPLQKENPDMSNADISRLLGEVWRNASVVEKRPFLEREEVERKIYKAKMEAWKNDQKLQKSMKKSASVDQTGHDDQQRQDVTSSTREDSYSRFDSGQHTMYPRDERNQSETGRPYYEYVYNPGQSQQYAESAYAVKYSYPRPPGDY